MTREAIATAVAEAKRFLERAKPVLAQTNQYGIEGGKDTGALRRASLDLTRALADMRKY